MKKNLFILLICAKVINCSDGLDPSQYLESILPPIPEDIMIVNDDFVLLPPKENSTFSVVSPLYDEKFKKIFGTSDKSEERTKAFLNDVWGFTGDKTIVEINFLPVSKFHDDTVARTCFFDIMCTDQQGSKYIIEVQKQNHAGFFKRIFYYSAVELVQQGSQVYTSVTSSRYVRSGKPLVLEGKAKSHIFYQGLLPVKTLTIANFKLFSDRPGYIHFADIVFSRS